MRSAYEEAVGQAKEIERNLLQGTARICSSAFGIAWKALHPIKSAEELAARIGCSVRTAGYELSGEHEPSLRAVLALIEDVSPKSR